MVASTVGSIALARGRLDEAEAVFLRGLMILQKERGLNHPDLAEPLCNLAMVDRQRGRLVQAEARLLRALRLWKKAPRVQPGTEAVALEQPGHALHPEGPLRRGRDPAGAGPGDRRGGEGPGSPPGRRHPAQPGAGGRVAGPRRRCRGPPETRHGDPPRRLGDGAPRRRHQPRRAGEALPAAPQARRGRGAAPAVAGHPGPGPRRRALPGRDEPERAGALYRDWNKPEKAEALYRRALAIREKALAPRLALPGRQPRQPGAGAGRSAQGPGLPGAVGTLRWRSARRPRAPTTRSWPRRSTTWRTSTRRGASTPRPSRSTSARWPSARRRSAPRRRPSPGASITSASSTPARGS